MNLLSGVNLMVMGMLGFIIGFQVKQHLFPSTGRDKFLRYSTPIDESEILRLMESEQKIRAIKAIRQYTGWGLKQAKDYVDAYPNVSPLPEGISHGQPQNDRVLEEDLRALLLQRRKIEAIKHYRQLTGQGLAKAKAYVDSVEQEMNRDRS